MQIDNSFGQIKPFTFNAAFGEETSQQDIFEGCGIKHLVEMSVQGFVLICFNTLDTKHDQLNYTPFLIDQK